MISPFYFYPLILQVGIDLKAEQFWSFNLDIYRMPKVLGQIDALKP